MIGSKFEFSSHMEQKVFLGINQQMKMIKLCKPKVHLTAPQMHSCRVSANLRVYNWGFDT